MLERVRRSARRARAICDQLGGGKYNPVIKRAIQPQHHHQQSALPLEARHDVRLRRATPPRPGTRRVPVTRKTHTFLGHQVRRSPRRGHPGRRAHGGHARLVRPGQCRKRLVLRRAIRAGRGRHRDRHRGLLAVRRRGVRSPGSSWRPTPRSETTIARSTRSATPRTTPRSSRGQSVTVHGKTYNNVLVTHEFSGLEPSANERKFYAPNVGNVLVIDDETGDIGARRDHDQLELAKRRASQGPAWGLLR